MRIVDSLDGVRACPPGEVGELLVRCPQMMDGYWENPQETQQALRGGWLYTGDLGWMDESGMFFIVDRKKDVIKPGGFQVWPQEVENTLMEHPAVAEAGVAGVPDEHQGEAVKAWVVLKAQAGRVEPGELSDFCRRTLAAYKVPRQIAFVEALPKSHLGKLVRSKLHELD